MNLQEWKSLEHDDWKTEPISCTCEVLVGKNKLCDKTTVTAYPAMGGGWQALCKNHSLRHKEAFNVDDLIRSGEKWR